MADQIFLAGDAVDIQPFLDYVRVRAVEKNAFVQSGVVQVMPDLDGVDEGDTIDFRRLFDLPRGDAQNLPNDGVGKLETRKRTTDKEKAIIISKGNSWQVNDFGKALTGLDPTPLGNEIADWWVDTDQLTLFSVLKGVMAAATMSGLVKDISGLSGGASKISVEAVIDAQHLRGDRHGETNVIGMHSDVFAALRKQQLIDFVPDATGTLFPMYQLMRVLVDDGFPKASDIYDTFLFAPAAVATGNANTPHAFETDRESREGNDILITRKNYFKHVPGVSWTGTAAESGIHGPTDAELEDGSNWTRIIDTKLIKLVLFRHKI